MMIEKYGIKLRFVEIDDAEFILSLRLNEKLGRYISPTEHDLTKQIEWIKSYKKREAQNSEFYFLTLDKNGNKQGLCRIYDFNETSFEFGSWLFSPDAPKGVAILSNLCAIDYGFEIFKCEICRININKQNNKVLKYCNSFEAIITHEDDSTLYFDLYFDKYIKQHDKLIKVLKK